MSEKLVEIERIQELFPGYDIIDKHEGGSQATVYMASHITTDRTVAIKILTQGFLASERYRQRFFNEIDMISQLDHENIVTLYDFGEVADYPYYIMQHVLGMPIADHVFLHEYNTRRCVEMFLKVCDALSCAHAVGIMHRDIKPSNIIVTAEHKPYVLDFGLGKHFSEQERRQQLFETEPFLVVGTVPYMSPEQAQGLRVDVRSDQYALAVLLYEMITDELPYQLVGSREQAVHAIVHEEPAPLRRHLSRRDRCKPGEVDRDLQAIMSKALRKDPAQRYDGVNAFAGDLRRWLAGEAVAARSGNTAYLLRKAARKHTWPLLTGLLVLVTAAGLWVRSERLRESYKDSLEMGAYLRMASTARDLDRVDDAQTMLQTVIDMGGELSGPVQDQQRFAFSAHCRKAELALAQHDLDDARKHRDIALEMAQARLVLDGADPDARRAMGGVWRLDARVRMAEKDWQAAADALQRATEIREQLCVEDPDNETLERELASTLALRGTCLRKLKHYEDSRTVHDREHGIRLKLHARNPNLDNKVSLAYSNLYLANWHMVQKTTTNDASAREHLHQARDILSASPADVVRPRDARRLDTAIKNNLDILDRRNPS